MRRVIWITIFSVLSLGILKAFSGTLSSYANTKTLVNADRIAVIIGVGNTNGNINWYDLKELMSKNINWTDVKAITANFGGDHTGINWQSLGA